MHVNSFLLLTSLLLLLPSIEMKKSGRGRGLRGARHKLTRDRYGFTLGYFLGHLLSLIPRTSHEFVLFVFDYQGERSWPIQQIRPLQACFTCLRRVNRIWRYLCGLSGPSPQLYSQLTNLDQKTQAPPSSAQQDQNP